MPELILPTAVEVAPAAQLFPLIPVELSAGSVCTPLRTLFPPTERSQLLPHLRLIQRRQLVRSLLSSKPLSRSPCPRRQLPIWPSGLRQISRRWSRLIPPTLAWTGLRPVKALRAVRSTPPTARA